MTYKGRFILCVGVLICSGNVDAEITDPIYRDGIIFNINEHAALTYRYDHGNGETYVVHSAGVSSHEANSVRIGNWSEFLGSGTYVGKRNVGTPVLCARGTNASSLQPSTSASFWRLRKEP